MDLIFCFSLPGTGVASPDNLRLGTLDMKDYALNQAGKFPSAHNDIVWAFDLGRASLGDSPAPGGVRTVVTEHTQGKTGPEAAGAIGGTVGGGFGLIYPAINGWAITGDARCPRG